MSNITEEQVVAYITGNLNENEKNQVMQEIEKDPEINKLYHELKDIRNNQEQLVSDFISRPIPDKTLNLFKKKSEKLNLINRIKKGYLTIIGWLGFIATSSVLLLPSTQMQIATFRGDSTELQIAKLEDELLQLERQIYTFRGIDDEQIDTSYNEIGDKKMIKIAGKDYEFKIISIDNFDTKTCVIFTVYDNGKKITTEEICQNK